MSQRRGTGDSAGGGRPEFDWSGEKLLPVVRHLPYAVAVFDTDLRYVTYSDRWLQDYQLSDQDLTGRSHYEVFPEIPAHWKEIHQRCLKGAVESNPEDSFERADGRTEWLRWEVRPWKGNEGEIQGLIMLTEVITDRKQTELELLEKKEKLRQTNAELRKALQHYNAILESGVVAVALADAEGNILDVNRAFEELLGYSHEELTTLNLREFTHPEDNDDTFKLYSKLLDGTQDFYRLEKRYRRNDGRTVWVNAMGAAVRNDDGSIRNVVGMVVDITPAKIAEAELVEREEQLRLVNKELESIVYVSSHDLRSPLVNLQGFSRKLTAATAELRRLYSQEELPETLRAGMRPLVEERIPEALEFIDASTVKMDRLITGLLRLSRLGRVVMRPRQVDMNALMKEVLKAMQYMLTLNEFDVEVDELPPCWGDADQLNQVFSNLVDNAIKYRSQERKPRLRITGQRKGEMVEYVVEDNGIGIDRRHKDMIFEVFHRLNPRDGAGGEGLGLTVVRRILDRSHGSIEVESDTGEGSRFSVTLPATKKAARA